MHRSTEQLEPLIRRACLLEATARKPGNVHPAAAFADLCYDDFVMAAAAVAPVLAQTRHTGVGRSILDAVRATREATGGNVNLGIVLLLAPLAAVPAVVPLAAGIQQVLDQLTQADAALAYEAIRIARPGGLGRVESEDVAGEPSGTLLDVMRLAADRDAIAGQYATGFRLVLETGVPVLTGGDRFARQWEQAVVQLQLTLMAESPDSLIARKLGHDEARQSAARARDVLAAGWPATRRGRQKLLELDEWLRAVGHARNPGTTADLIAATLFAALRDGLIEVPPGMG